MEKKNNNKIVISLLLGIMCCFLTAGIFIQIKTVKNSTTTIGKTQIENQLRDSVLRWKEKYENTNDMVQKKEKELENLRNQAANSTDSSSVLSSKLEKYNSLLGYTELIGKGIIITLEDGDASNKAMATNCIVHDLDLIEVVNALKNADADAISINEQRITSRTAIQCVGNVITVNGKKIGSPFVIKAIGPTVQLYTSVKMAGGYVDWLEYWGVKVKVEQVEKENIIIPKYEGVYKTEYITNIK